MEGALYVIKENFDVTVSIFEVEYKSKSEKQYKLDDARVYRSVINKSEFYFMKNGFMFGTDKNKLIKKWNEDIEGYIEKYSKMLNYKSKLLIK